MCLASQRLYLGGRLPPKSQLLSCIATLINEIGPRSLENFPWSVYTLTASKCARTCGLAGYTKHCPGTQPVSVARVVENSATRALSKLSSFGLAHAAPVVVRRYLYNMSWVRLRHRYSRMSGFDVDSRLFEGLESPSRASETLFSTKTYTRVLVIGVIATLHATRPHRLSCRCLWVFTTT